MSDIKTLVIDHDKYTVKLFERIFDRLGYEVIVAHDATSGRHIARTQPIDLILLNLLLPDVSGIELAHQLRSDRQIPIIGLSIRELEIGVDDMAAFSYIAVAPLDIHELIKHVQDILATNKQMD